MEKYSDMSARAWHHEVFAVLRETKIRQVAYVPDAGFDGLLGKCLADPDMLCTVLTTEEEGVALLAGAWLGGDRGVLMMQSSGVGNCLNMLTLTETCRFPLLSIVTMRGEWKEFNPWQEPMGRNTQAALELSGATVFRVDESRQAAETVAEAAESAFGESRSAAVLISQKVIGEKKWQK